MEKLSGSGYRFLMVMSLNCYINVIINLLVVEIVIIFFFLKKEMALVSDNTPSLGSRIPFTGKRWD